MKALTLTGVAERIGIKRRTLYNMKKDGRFPVAPIKGTNPPLYNSDHIDTWMNEQEGET